MGRNKVSRKRCLSIFLSVWFLYSIFLVFKFVLVSIMEDVGCRGEFKFNCKLKRGFIVVWGIKGRMGRVFIKVINFLGIIKSKLFEFILW